MLTLPLTTGSPYHNDRVRDRSRERDIGKSNSLERITGPRSPAERETADQQKQVADLFAAMRETSLQLATLKRNNSSNSSLASMGAHSPHSGCSNDSLSIDLNTLTQSFEVLYVGRMKVSSKKAPPTFIDDALEKLRLHELDKMIRKRQGGDHDSDVGSQESVDEDTHRLIPVESVISLNYASDHTNEEEHQYNNLEDEPYLRTQSCALAFPSSHNQNSVEDHPRMGLGIDKQTEGENRTNKTQSLVTNVPRRPRSASSDGNNRTMLLQIGKAEMSLISPEKKSPLLQKQFKDVVYCAQGQKNNDHFGFICREQHLDTYVAYIFRCQSDSVAEYVLTALKQSSSNAQESVKKEKQQKAITSCPTCPTMWFSRLGAEVEGVSPSRAHVTIMKRLEELPEQDRMSILTKLQGAETTSAMEENDLLMMLIKAQCEVRQQTHTHETEHKDAGTLERALFTTKKSFAKLSDILKRKDQRETSPTSDDFPVKSHFPTISPENTPRGGSPPLATLKREGSVGSNDTSELPPSGAHRPRSSTLGTSGGDSMKREFLRKKKNSMQQQQQQNQQQQQQQQHKANMLNIIMRMGSQGSQQNKLQPEEPEPNTPMRRSSFRKAIFHHVNTPPPKGNMTEVLKSRHHSSGAQVEKCNKQQRKRPTKELMVLWKRYIFRQMVLQRIEREIRRLKAIQHETEQKRLKLEYEDVCHVPDRVNADWEVILTREDRTSHRLDPTYLAEMIKRGIFKKKRGEVWKLLVEQHRLVEGNPSTEDVPYYYTPYEDFLKELTDQHHAILVDLSRTFPNHPYYQKSFGPGQLALFNLLKAYSLLDPEVGYCQGLSFIAGILLLHTSEVDAFDLLKHIMFALGFRRQYKPDMAALQEQMYQLSRILHDRDRELYEHLEKNDIAPSLYAAPWFLTCFASQFSIGFVARVFDLIYLQGMDAIFKIALVLLKTHKEGLLKCEGFEDIMEYLKNTMPVMNPDQANSIIKQAASLGISRQLHAYEVEYNVIKDEMQCTPQKTDPDILQKLENNNRSLRRLNMELLEKLQKAHSHEANATHYKAMVHKLETKLRALETEHAILKESIEAFITCIPENILLTMQMPIRCRKLVSEVMQNSDNLGHESREMSPANSWNIGSMGSSFESGSDSPPPLREGPTHDKHVRFQVDYDEEDDDYEVNDIMARGKTPRRRLGSGSSGGSSIANRVVRF